MPKKQSTTSNCYYKIVDATLVSADLTPIDYDFTNLTLNGQDAHQNINDPNHDVAIIFTLSYIVGGHHERRRSCRCVLHDNTVYKVCQVLSSTRHTVTHDVGLTQDLPVLQPLIAEAL